MPGVADIAHAAGSSHVLRDSFARDGFVVVRGLLPRADVMALRARAEALVQDAASGTASPYVQIAFDAAGAVKLVKASGLVERDAAVPRHRHSRRARRRRRNAHRRRQPSLP